jgi:hypothetical protein
VSRGAQVALFSVALLFLPNLALAQAPPIDLFVTALFGANTQDDCISARNKLHAQSWATDQDLSKRALAGVCFNYATGEVATDYVASDDGE